MADEDRPVLDLDTLIRRPKIAIDGALYEILSPDEISVLDHHRFAVQGKRIDALMSKEALTPQEEAELAGVVRGVADRIMVGVPEAARYKLSDSQRLDVIEVFTRLPLRAQMERLIAAGAQAETGSRSTGAKRRRGSSASTAATPTGGSPARPSPSSART